MMAARSSRVLLALAAQVLQVDRAVIECPDHHDPHAGHDRRRRVGPVRARRDQADVALALATRPVVCRDGQQPGQFPLAAGVRLHRHLGVARDPGQPFLQLVDERQVAGRALRAARTDGCRRTRAGRRAPSRSSRSASWCTTQAGSCPGRARSPGRTGGAGSAAWPSRSGAPRRRGGAGSAPGGAAPRAARSRRRTPPPGTPNASSTAAQWAAVVVSPHEIPTWSSSTSRRRTPRAAGIVDDGRRPTRRLDHHRVEELAVDQAEAGGLQSQPPARPCAGGRGGRCHAAPRRRGTPRTWRRPPPTGPARCRCWTSPSPGGCAARASAARAGRPGGPPRRSRARPGVRADRARGHP